MSKRKALKYKVLPAYRGSTAYAVDGQDSFGDWFTVEYCDSLSEAQKLCCKLREQLHLEKTRFTQ